LLLAAFTSGDAFLSLLEFFFIVMYIWILIVILSDLFRDHELNGWAKAAWVLFLLVIPYLSALVYLIARGHGMRDRAIQEQADAKKQMDAYIQEQAHAGSPADELHKLSDLKDKGAITDTEFEAQKAKILA
jgi:hypothetical protein